MEMKIITAKILMVKIFNIKFRLGSRTRGSGKQAMAFVMVILAFKRPSSPQLTCLHPLACDDIEAVGSATDESKPSTRSSNNQQVCRQPGSYSSFFKIPRQQQRPRCPQRRYSTLSPLCIASTENDTIDTFTYV